MLFGLGSVSADVVLANLEYLGYIKSMLMNFSPLSNLLLLALSLQLGAGKA